MARSELTIDLGAVRRNAKAILAALDGAELWAVVKADGYGHGAVSVADAALGAGATALCVATVPEALALRRDFSTTRILVMGPASNREIAQAREAQARAGRPRRRAAAGGDSAPPEARHRHGPLRARGAADPAAPGRRVHVAPRDRRLRSRVRRAADRALPGRDRAVSRLHPAHREQRRRAADARLAVRRGPLRDRAARPVAVRRRPGRRRARAGALLAQRAGPGQAPRARARAPGTGARSSPSSRPGSGSSRSATGTASGAT